MKKISCLFILSLLLLNMQAQLASLDTDMAPAPISKPGPAQAGPTMFPELYYEIKIAYLNEETSLELFYDETVEEYINLFLTSRKSDYLIFKERAVEYFPIIEEYLKEYNMPPELKYVAVLESGLNPAAVSPSKAIGLWQFKKATGQSFGLKINGSHDDRLDPELATKAACTYLTELYEFFGSWELSLLAYNTGPTALNNAIRANNGSSEYFSLLPHLSSSTQRYLPALMAIIYLFENHGNHFAQN